MEFTKTFNSKYGEVEVNYLVQDGQVHLVAILPDGCEMVEHSLGYMRTATGFESIADSNKQSLTTRGEIERAYICFAPVPYQGKKHRVFISVGGSTLAKVARPMPSKSQEEALNEFLNEQPKGGFA